jgi:integrase
MAVLVRQRKGKKGWWVITTHKGTRRYKSFASEATADTYAREVRKALARGDPSPTAARRLLGPYFEQWLADHAKLYCKPSTYELYCTTWRRWTAPQLAHRPLASITRDDMRTFVAHMARAGKSRAYIKGTLAPLSAVFTRAVVEDHLMSYNPAAKIIPPVRGEIQKRVGQALTKDQLTRLVTTCQTRMAQWYPLVLLYARSGLRLREALALQWGDIDFVHGCLWVRRTLSARGKIQTPKGGRAERVDMSTQLAAVLRAVKPAQAQDSDLVFPNTRGKPMHADNFRNRIWRKLFILAGIPRVRIHDLRHTFATRLIEEGEHLPYVQQQLRHRSIRTTVDLYGHLVPGYNRGAVDKLDD